MPQSPLDASDGALRVHVKHDGRPLDDGFGLISAHIRHAVAGSPTARLVIADGDMPAGQWPMAIPSGPLP